MTFVPKDGGYTPPMFGVHACKNEAMWLQAHDLVDKIDVYDQVSIHKYDDEKSFVTITGYHYYTDEEKS